MKKFFRFFKRDDGGAVTVDWVVLTAMITILAGSGFLATQNGVQFASNYIQSDVSSQTVR